MRLTFALVFARRLPSAARLLAATALALPLLSAGLAAHAAGGACQGVANCLDLGTFTATVVKVNVTRQDAVTAYQGVRTTVRLTNTGTQPLILGYRDRSSAVTDNNGLAYRWSSKATGIGVVSRGSADTQFQLAPGQSREASFDGVVQYSMRRQVAGTVFTHDITLVELAPLGGSQVREVRDHALSFAGLTASAGYGAGAAAVAPGATSTASPDAPATTPTAGAAQAAPNAAACADAQHCQAAGPLVANVVRVNVTRAGSVTAYQTVRTTVRFTNAGIEPLILGYRQGSGMVSDDKGQAYRWSSKASGIGIVDRNQADPQFRLAPGESREAAFESTLQYNVRYATPGTVFSHDLTIAQLAIVGPAQVRTLHEYALSFTDLRAGSAGPGAVPSGGDAVLQAVGGVADLLKGLKR